MQRKFSSYPALCAVAALLSGPGAFAQMMPGGGAGGGMPGRSGPTMGGAPPSSDDMSTQAPTEKPDAAAKKAYKAAMKYLNKARENEAIAAAATNPDKRANALEKVGDAYNSALDQFTEALSHKGDMVEAWDNVGYVHLRLGAYGESIDDYNHALALKPDLLDAVEHRGEAYLAVDRLDDAKMAYMDLYNHDQALAERLMQSMQKWLAAHQADARGMRAADISAFEKWLLERDSIAKQTASLPH
jgi:tetratricopeptide (TPR) repeat protein